MVEGSQVVKSDVIYLPAGPVPTLRPRRTRLMTIVALAVAGLAMTSCTTFGTNISGKFGCGAPAGGSCAPATVIDDKALAEITGDTSFRPAVQYQRAPVRSAPESVAIAATGTVGVRPQKVLRIVFPAHTDGAGRYHETSVVQAMVDSSQWVAATNGHGPGLAASTTLNVSPEILSQLGAPIDAVTANERATAERLAADTTPVAVPPASAAAPTVGAVAAARAKAKGDRPLAATRPAAPAPTPVSTPVAAASPAGQRIASSSPANRPARFSPNVED
jgi:conjugal transfer pilus assembly protein TraV